MKNIDEKILMAEEEIKQLQNKRKKLISQQKQEERKKRDRRIYEKGAVFESIFTESKDFTKDEFYQLITFPNIKETVNQKILKVIAKREESENKITETQEEVTETEK
ncbi:PF12958 family protein [Peptostreptococcaceae bacterium AS15]|nr:PF12958 family protein [Peptostreptococcaceae bacterium AS15]